MEIPPFIRITPNILTKFSYKNDVFYNLCNRNDKLDPIIINNAKSNLNENTKLTNYNLNELVDSISHYLNKSNVSFHGLLDYNLNKLEKRDYEGNKIINKLAKILNYRILSISDKLNTNQLSKLIFCLTQSSEQFSDLTLKLFELFLEKSSSNVVSTHNNDVYDYFLVLSSFLIFKSKFNNENIENKLIDKINLINFNGLNFSNDVLLQFLQTLAFLNFEKINQNVIEQIFYKLDVEKMKFNEMCTLVHTYSLLQTNMTFDAQNIMEGLLERINKNVMEVYKNDEELSIECLPKLFHYFYITNELDNHLMSLLVEIIVKRNITFQFSNDFYRVTFPISLSNLISHDKVVKWMLDQLIDNYDNYVKQLSNFLFILMRVASSARIEPNKVLNGVKGSMMESLYEEALMYLNEKVYLPTNRSKLLYLFDKIMEFIQSADSDQFIQILHVLSHKLVKINTAMKLKLMKECKERVNSTSVGGISHVLDFITWVYSNKNPDCITILEAYQQRILSDISTYNTGDRNFITTSELYNDSYLSSVKILSNILYIFDWASLYSSDLSSEVSILINNNTHMEKILKLVEMEFIPIYQILISSILVEGDVSDICHIIHYISRSNEQPNDIFYIVLFDKMKNASEVEPTDLILLLESFIANSLHLRYKELLEEVEKRVKEIRAEQRVVKLLVDCLNKVTNNKYTFKENENNFTLQLES